MNRALASILSLLNGLFAILIIVGGAAIGHALLSGSAIGLVLGAIIGLLIAALTCGVIAYLTLIERHLAKIAGDHQRATARTDRSIERRDPGF